MSPFPPEATGHLDSGVNLLFSHEIFFYVSSPITELAVDLNIKEKYRVLLVHDPKSMAASESSNVPRHEWAVGSDHPSVFLRCIVVRGQSDKTLGCHLELRRSSKRYRPVTFL